MDQLDRRRILGALGTASIGAVSWGLSSPAGAQPAAAPAPAAPPAAPRSPPTPLASADPAILALADRWTYSDWAGPPIGVFSWMPPGAWRDCRVMLVYHGVNRDADRYFTQWQPVAARRGFAIVVPEYATAQFPQALNYNQGGVLDAQGRVRPRSLWAFGTPDGLFAAYRRRARLRTTRYELFGHSAGSQFVHRALLAAPPRRTTKAIAANAGFYTWPDLERPWPFGLKDSPIGERDLRAWLARDMVVLLGTADNHPQHRSLNRDPPAMQQGEHRLARGNGFFEAGQALAAARGWRFGWTRSYAPDVDHDNARMAPFAADLFYGPG